MKTFAVDVATSRVVTLIGSPVDNLNPSLSAFHLASFAKRVLKIFFNSFYFFALLEASKMASMICR